MELQQIMDVAQYQFENYKPKLDKVSDIIFDSGEGNYVKTLNHNKSPTFITQAALDQLLERIYVRQSIKGLNKIIEKPTNQKLFSEHKVPTKKGIIKRIIKLGISQSVPLQFIKDENLGQIVGVVGKGYKFYPQWKVIEESEKVYGQAGEDCDGGVIDPRFSYINDKKMKLYYTIPKIHLTPLNCEEILFGYNVGNSQNGHSSTHVYNNGIFNYCTNGVIFDAINMGFWKSHRVDLSVLFPQKLRTVKKEKIILDLIDRFINQKPLFSVDSLTDPLKLVKLNNLLTKYGIPTKEHRKEVVQILKKENQDMNTYNIGSAVNYYASNVLTDAVMSHQLLRPAYEIMSLQS